MGLSVDDVKAKVHQYLAKNFEVGLSDDLGFHVDYGSTRVFVSVAARGEEADPPIVVRVSAPVAFGVPETPEMLAYVARHTDSWLFGHLGMAADAEAPETHRVFFVHRLLGNYMEEEELVATVVAVLYTADRIDDDFVAQFGGRRFHE